MKEMYPHCPVCGQECETVFVTDSGEIVGCDDCIREKDAWEERECFPDDE